MLLHLLLWLRSGSSLTRLQGCDACCGARKTDAISLQKYFYTELF